MKPFSVTVSEFTGKEMRGWTVRVVESLPAGSPIRSRTVADFLCDGWFSERPGMRDRAWQSAQVAIRRAQSLCDILNR